MHTLRFVVLFALIVVGAPISAMAAPLDIRSVTLTDAGDLVLFETVFDRAPDFATVDEYGRHHDAFQFTLTHNMEHPYLLRDVWILGVGIESGFIPVFPMQTDGEYGPLSASLPYLVSQIGDDHLLSFAVPYSALSSPDSVFPADGRADNGTGAFQWFLETYQYGTSPYATNHANGQYPVNVPEPGSLLHIGVGLGVCLRALARKGRRGLINS
jgi:hypothetical protein